MSFKDDLSEIVDIEKSKIPSSYQVIGDIILIKLLRIDNGKDKKRVAEAIMKLYPRIKTVMEVKQVSGEFREPKVVKLSGDGSETVHTESGIKFKLDVSKVMFSKGNLFERQRLLDQINKDDIVVDMFAGIGYFSLGVAKKAKKVICIEKNKVSYKYLNENVKLNKLSNVKTINSDCHDVEINENADHVLMGYFPGTEKFLEKAFSFVGEKGVIHYHNIYKKNDLWDEPISEIEHAANKSGYRIEKINKRKVKSYSPSVWHVVMDVEVSKL